MKTTSSNKKKIDDSVLDIVSGLGNATQQLSNFTNETQYSDDVVNFSFVLEKTKIQWLREYVLKKRTTALKFFHFSNTDAVKEGIALLREKYPDLEQRPKTLKYSTKVGRTYGAVNKAEKMNTSYSITEKDKGFIYDLIYFKSTSGEEYTKTDFFNELIEELSKNIGK